MKKCLITIVFVLFYTNINSSSTPIKKLYIKPILEQKTDIIEAIGKVESGLNSKYINRIEQARGFLQIRPILVKEVNRILGNEIFDTTDCYNISKSIMMYKIIQDKYNPTENKEIAAKLWNGGPNWRQKESVKEYWNKVKRYL